MRIAILFLFAAALNAQAPTVETFDHARAEFYENAAIMTSLQLQYNMALQQQTQKNIPALTASCTAEGGTLQGLQQGKPICVHQNVPDAQTK